jgi:hypothetical protein
VFVNIQTFFFYPFVNAKTAGEFIQAFEDNETHGKRPDTDNNSAGQLGKEETDTAAIE